MASGSTILKNATPVTSHMKKEKEKYKMKVIWHKVLLYTYMYASLFYGLSFIFEIKFITYLWGLALGTMGGLGITAGAHRLWSHRSYKATWQLRTMLALFHTMSAQIPIYKWAREHRVHHKFSETDADPFNATRGIFFSHVGWLMVRKHPEVIRRGQTLNFSDLENDPIVMFQKKWYIPLSLIFAIVIPVVVPWYFWNESFHTMWYTMVMFRVVLTLNMICLINSMAHHLSYGKRPYDKNINPADSIGISISTFGEGSHNFHHTFPWDYRSSELSVTNMNLTTGFINLFARIGWAYDLKFASEDLIRKRALRTGDGTYDFKRGLQSKDGHNFYGDKTIWGWGDSDLPIADQKATVRERCHMQL